MSSLDFETGDKVEIQTQGFYLGSGIITSFTKGIVRQANVETFDGCHYTVPMSELIKIGE